MGETGQGIRGNGRQIILSVSSNGSLWVKLLDTAAQLVVIDAPFSILERIVMGETSSPEYAAALAQAFQYPRTDRYG